MRRYLVGFVASWLISASAFAQGVMLGEEVKPGDHFRYEIALTVDGKMKVERNGRLDAITLKAKASHTFLERVDAADARGGGGRAIRHYSTATSEAEVASDRSKHELGADRRLVVAQRTTEGSLHFSPDGPLSRDELELVAEHFDTLCLPGLLPAMELKPGDTWKVGADAVQYACLFEGLIKAEVSGKFVEVKDGVAVFTITGTAEGVESGAQAKVAINATGKFDTAAKRITELTWEQTDDRAQGPATPASEVKAVITLKRAALADEPKELNAEARARVPADGKVPPLLVHLRYADPDGRYQFVYPRDWRIVGRTKDHLVLRLLDKGEFAAQAAITTWKKAEPGKHSEPGEFKKSLTLVPGWIVESILEDGVVPTEAGRWLYRVAAKGKQDGLPVVQTFHLLAGPNGDQVTVSVLVALEKAEKLGARDVALVNAIEFKK